MRIDNIQLEGTVSATTWASSGPEYGYGANHSTRLKVTEI
jgi:hypothetical protein